MKKYLFLLGSFIVAGPLFAQTLEIAAKAGGQIRRMSRVAGADISGYSEIGRLWAQEYRLNEKF